MNAAALSPTDLVIPLTRGMAPWLVFSILAGLAAAAAFYLALGRGLRSLPTYLLLGAAVAPLFQLVSAELPILPLPLVVGEVQTLIVVVGTWGLLSIARALHL
jgi:hypothetical protein